MTRATIETRILSLYTADALAEAYNISEIARKTGAAYPHVHAAVGALIKQQVLDEQLIGRSRYCTVNLANPLARALLIQAHLLARQKQLAQPNMRNLLTELQRLAADEPGILAAIQQEHALRLIVTDSAIRARTLHKTSLINLSFSTPKEFRKELLHSMQPLAKATILLGHDALLLHVTPAQQQLMLNHAAAYRGTAQKHATRKRSTTGKKREVRRR